MAQLISPQMERVFTQLKWLERKRARIIESVSAHFGTHTVLNILQENHLSEPLLNDSSNFFESIDHRNPNQFLHDLAYTVEETQAKTIQLLRTRVSIYQDRVDEQIIFGARTAGQEAGRSFLAHIKPFLDGRVYLNLSEAVQAILEITYNGLPNEKNYFLIIRPLGGATLHMVRSPHSEPWQSAKGDEKFLYQLKEEWIRGALDIIAPSVLFTTKSAIELGSSFGLAHFYQRGIHAEP